MGHIDWIPIAEMPNALRDGRQVLLWQHDVIAGAEVGTWLKGDIWNDEDRMAGGRWEALYDSGRIDGVTHFAEINPPAN